MLLTPASNTKSFNEHPIEDEPIGTWGDFGSKIKPDGVVLVLKSFATRMYCSKHETGKFKDGGLRKFKKNIWIPLLRCDFLNRFNVNLTTGPEKNNRSEIDGCDI